MDPRRYLEAARRYLVNAEAMYGRRELRKASEMLWGAIAQCVKAVAAVRGISIDSHRRLIEFVRELARELGDEDLYRSFLLARLLHTNFYDEVLTEGDFEIVFREGYKLVERICGLAINQLPPLDS